jgi:alpha-beta hydrolase superfamily lysophospholipase
MGSRVSVSNSDTKTDAWPDHVITRVEECLERNYGNPRLVRFWENSYPVENPVDIQVTRGSEVLTLANYLYPSKFARSSPSYKGIVFW